MFNNRRKRQEETRAKRQETRATRERIKPRTSLNTPSPALAYPADTCGDVTASVRSATARSTRSGPWAMHSDVAGVA